MQDIKTFLKKYNFSANKLLGQNFLINDEVLEKIVEAADLKTGDEVLEIGPGIGNLTKLLAKQSVYVLAVEKDQRYFPILKDQLGKNLMAHTRTPKTASNVELFLQILLNLIFKNYLNQNIKLLQIFHITFQEKLLRCSCLQKISLQK